MRGRTLLVPLAATLAVGGVTIALGAALGGTPAAVGALIGTALVTGVFVSGALVLGVVATALPAASLLVALLTYTLQVLAVALVYVSLQSGGALDGPVDPRWLSAAVIAGTLVWTIGHLVATVRAREPAYAEPAPERRGTRADQAPRHADPL